MDRNALSVIPFRLSVALIAVVLTALGGEALAQNGPRMVYNPVTRRTEPETRTAAPASVERPVVQAAAQATRRRPQPTPQAVEPAGYAAPCGCGDAGCVGCGDAFCGDAVGCDLGCGDIACGGAVGRGLAPATIYTGFEATFVKPRFEDNVAFTVMQSDGASFESFTDTPFDHDLEMSPRVFFGWRHSDGVGLRATWWDFDHEAAAASANPPANGFGQITHPAFGGVDISSVVPGDTFSAASALSAYTIDLEATKDTSFCGWDLGVAGGLRYARVEQSYLAQLSDNADALRGQIDYRQSIEGFGPTISLSAVRPLTARTSLFCKARGSLLFGDGQSDLAAGEDLDLSTPFNTTATTSRDDLLTIGEVQVGFRWDGVRRSFHPYRPFVSLALEGQSWGGAGSATSEDGALGFFGFNTSVGVDW